MPNETAASGRAEPLTERVPAPRHNDSRVSDSRVMERRLPSAREALATLPEGQAPDFEPHDTIPAPTWLDDEIAPTQKAP